MISQDDAYQDMVQTHAFALLTMADTSLRVPQNQIISLEPVLDISHAPPGRGNVGTIRFQSRSVPVYRLNNLRRTQQELTADHRFTVIFEYDGIYFGLLCKQMQSVSRDRLILNPIPVCMQQADMVFTALAIFDNSVIKVTSKTTLAMHLELARGGAGG